MEKILFPGLIRIISLIAVSFISVQVTGQKIKSVTGLLYNDLKPVSIEIRDGRILKIKKLENIQKGESFFYVAPGLIDNQVNGFAGVSFSFGGSELNMTGIRKATRELWKEGVTSYLPTLTTSSRELLLSNFSVLAGAVVDSSILGSIPGFHLEGPYISQEDGYRGAHPKKYVRLPDWDEFENLFMASGKNILQVTLAPELEGAMEFIRNCRGKGIVVALGHHNASKTIIDMAVEEGARISTHLGNGCANLINRHVNPIWPQLANDKLMISIIGDGFHLRPEEIDVFFKVKGPERTIITSDVTHFATLPSGNYTTADKELIELTPDGMLKYPAQDVLYGSASPITKGVGNVMKITRCSLSDAIRMASTNTAALYQLKDRGKIEPGLRADLIMFSVDSNFHITIHKTIVAGNLVYNGLKN